MSKETVTYRVYFYPGSFFNEESASEVESRDVKKAQRDATGSAFAFQFYERSKTVIDGETLWGPEKNRSMIYYLGGKTYTAKEVEEQFPREKILLTNMRSNGYERVIKTRVGNFQPFEDKKAVLLK